MNNTIQFQALQEAPEKKIVALNINTCFGNLILQQASMQN